MCGTAPGYDPGYGSFGIDRLRSRMDAGGNRVYGHRSRIRSGLRVCGLCSPYGMRGFADTVPGYDPGYGSFGIDRLRSLYGMRGFADTVPGYDPGYGSFGIDRLRSLYGMRGFADTVPGYDPGYGFAVCVDRMECGRFRVCGTVRDLPGWQIQASRRCSCSGDDEAKAQPSRISALMASCNAIGSRLRIAAMASL
jgi:hypothetical protein